MNRCEQISQLLLPPLGGPVAVAQGWASLLVGEAGDRAVGLWELWQSFSCLCGAPETLGCLSQDLLKLVKTEQGAPVGRTIGRAPEW